MKASPRLVNLASGGGLAEASRTAYDGGVTALIRVGPWRSAPLAAKLVRVYFLEPRHAGAAVRIGLRWEAVGLFPVLDADITLAASGEHHSRLGLSGTTGRRSGGSAKNSTARSWAASLRSRSVRCSGESPLRSPARNRVASQAPSRIPQRSPRRNLAPELAQPISRPGVGQLGSACVRAT
jgi:hypothetical protein